MKCESVLNEDSIGNDSQSYYNFYLKLPLVVFFQGVCKAGSAYFCLNGQ